ncbi:cytochrome P450 86B1 [Nymphaea colorata]|nr:cytochrome P450 86B1 [Nymphaea colorata]
MHTSIAACSIPFLCQGSHPFRTATTTIRMAVLESSAANLTLSMVAEPEAAVQVSSPLLPPCRHPLLDVGFVELLLAFLAFLVLFRYSLKQQQKLRGLPAWPLLGMLPSLILGLRGDVYEWVSDVIIRRGGTFTFNGPWFTNLNCVITGDPRNVEYLLKTRFSSFPKGDYFRDVLRDFLGDGIFNADGALWRSQKKTVSMAFHSANFRKITASIVGDLFSSRLLPLLDAYANNDVAFDLQDVLLRLTLDNVCMMALSVDLGSLKPSLPAIPFSRSFEDATEMSTLRFLMPTAVWKMMRFFDLGPERRLRRSVRQVQEFVAGVIAARKKELSRGEGAERTDLVSIFMRARDEDGQPHSDEFLRDMCISFILAGRDTSSVALSWFFWLLGQNPAVEERIVAEIHWVVGERRSSFGREEDEVGGQVVGVEDVRKMHYLHAAITETLRLYPPVSIDHKEVIEDEVFPDGTSLKKGTKVLYCAYAMGRMESIWGKDCRQFKPERWIQDGQFTSEPAYKFPAFNGGPRLCLGKDFSYFQMKLIAANIISRFHVQIVPGHPVLPKLALTIYMKHGLKVVLHKREAYKMVP